MKKAFLFFLSLLLSNFCFSQNTYVPDDNFEQELINLGYDSGPLDDYVLTTNIESVTSLSLFNLYISDLTGIEDFVSLVDLNCDYNQLTSIDLTNNLNLVELYCGENNLVNLNLSQNENLTKLECYENNLTNLDLSNNTSLTYVDCNNNFISSIDVTQNILLEELFCVNNQISNLDITNNINLERLYFHSNNIETLDLSNNINLISLGAFNNNLTSLDITNNPNIYFFQANNNNLTTVDARNGNNTNMASLFLINNPNLECVFVDDITYSNNNWSNDIDANSTFVETQAACDALTSEPLTYVPDDNFEQELINLGYDSGPLDDYVPTANIDTVTELDVRELNIADLTGIEDFISLVHLIFYKNQVSEINLTQNINLESVSCGANLLSELNVTNNTLLKSISCFENQITSIDLTQNTLLEYLGADNNFFPSLDLSNNSSLRHVSCSHNLISTIDISNSPNLEYLKCSSNLLSALDVTNNTSLNFLVCSNNQISSLDVTNNTLLNHFVCSNNLLSELNVTNNTLLELFICNLNNISELDVSQNTLLNHLQCSVNNIPEVNVSQNTLLTIFYCNDNILTDLDLTKLALLTDLNCGDNDFTELDVSQNPLITNFQCPNNKLIELDLTNNSQLSTVNIPNSNLSILDLRNNNNANIQYYNSSQSPNLTCIFVDDANYSSTNWLDIDTASTFYETEAECDCIPPVIDELDDVSECGSYVLQPLLNGEYYTETLGGGTQLNTGDNIATSQIIYIYAEDSLDPYCYNENSFTIEIYPIIDFELTTNNIDISASDIQVNMVDGSINYEYAVDDPANYQTSNLFFNLSDGLHILFVRDENNCIEKSVEFQILSSGLIIPNFFTPNNDSENDYWEIVGANNIIESINIHDRFGKIMATFLPNTLGWNGYYNGKQMPSADYWYVIQLLSGEEIKGNFALVR